MDGVTLVALIVFVGAIPFAIALSLFMRYLADRKGSIVINTPTRNFCYGDTIRGSITVTPNKRLYAREVRIALVAIKKTRNREGSHIRRLQCIPQFLAEDVNLGPATAREFAFELKAPADNASADQPVTTAFKDLPMGTMLATTLKTLPSQLEWSLTAEVVCDGINLSGEKAISVLACGDTG